MLKYEKNSETVSHIENCIADFHTTDFEAETPEESTAASEVALDCDAGRGELTSEEARILGHMDASVAQHQATKLKAEQEMLNSHQAIEETK